MKQFTQILNKNEKIIWEGNPQKLPFILAPFFNTQFLLLTSILVAVLGPLFILGISEASDYEKDNIIFGLVAGIAALLSAPVGIFVYRLFLCKHVHYLITDKRIITQGGVIGRDFQFIDFDKTHSARVDIGVADKLFGKNSGSIFIHSGGIVPVYTEGGWTAVKHEFGFLHITDPYRIFEKFKKVSFDIKTDIQFPNEYRPAQNRGYQTTYQPKEKD